MTNKMDKKNLFRLMFEKTFCLHDYKEIHTISRMDKGGEVVSIRTLRECEICGKSKLNEI